MAFSILLIGIGVAVVTSSGRPVFFTQQRVGRGGRPFTIIKFRTMRADKSRDQGPLVTASGDPRVTRIGALLRRTKLDELPQLWNVLRGDMSLVGPRPETPNYVALYTPEQRRALDFRPGITCRSSIEMIDEERLLAEAGDAERCYRECVMPAKLELAIEYAEHATVWSDVAVIVSTVGKVAAAMIGQRRKAA